VKNRKKTQEVADRPEGYSYSTATIRIALLLYSGISGLGIYFTTNSTGQFVNESLKDAEKKIGNPFACLLSDQGSDVKKGTNIYHSNSKETVVVHDISHKIAIILEKELKSDPKWKIFCDYLSATKLKVQQTADLAALMPPKL
jgi:hypothetical protein